MHAVSDQSSMSAVALVAKQVEVSVMDKLCNCPVSPTEIKSDSTPPRGVSQVSGCLFAGS